jgi:hypothetical protein
MTVLFMNLVRKKIKKNNKLCNEIHLVLSTVLNRLSNQSAKDLDSSSRCVAGFIQSGIKRGTLPSFTSTNLLNRRARNILSNSYSHIVLKNPQNLVHS